MQNIKRLFTSLVLIILVCNYSVAQDADMMLYHVSGKVSVAGKSLQKGSLLKQSDILELSEGASVVLICKSFQVIKIKTKGKHPVKELMKTCNAAPHSFTASYFQYVWKEFTHKHGSPDANPLDYMKNVGAVNRGFDIVEAGISLDTIHYYRGELPLRLQNLPAHFTITVYNDEYDGGIEAKKSFTSGQVFLNTVFENLQPGIYYWQVADSNQNLSTRKYMKVWDKASYREEMDNLLKDIPQSTASETAFVEAFVLAENHFLQAAYTYLKLAATLNSHNKTYLHAYDEIFF